nr:putative F-box protein At1g65770 [Quercus suber]
MEKSKKENKDMDDGERVEWSELPKELLPTIGKNLDTRIDIVRFRSVCNTWRSSIPLFHSNSPRFPLIFPSPYPAPTPLRTPAYLCQSTIYRLQRLNPSSTSSNKAWLIKVEQDSNSGGKFRLFDPISNRRTRYPNKTLNLFDFRVVELTKAYTLRYQVRAGSSASTNEIEKVLSLSDISIFGVNKVVMFPNSPWTNVNASAAFVIFNDGKLGFAKSGDEELILVDRNSFDYDDIIVYKGQFYVINSLGIVSWIDQSSLKLVQFLPPLCGLGSQKHLVESCGALYVVDRYLDRERRRVGNDAFYFYMGGEDCAKLIGFKVYRFDEEWGRWELKESLDDRAFVLGNDCCFSVMAKELSGYKRNCIYFTDQNETQVFSLEDNSVGYLSYFEDSHPSWRLPNLL